MVHKWAMAVLLASLGSPPSITAQSSHITEVEFRSEGARVHGRFFSAADEPIATVLLLPGADFDPTEVLEMGALLSSRDVNVVTFAPRGTRGSEGTLTISNALDDIAAALLWLRGDEGRAFHVDGERIVIGGHSLGGGIAVAYAARDSTVGHLISIAGNDLGEYARRLRSDPALANGLRGRLSEATAPGGFARLDPEAVIEEILNNEVVYGHTENASRFADRAILLLGGWDDSTAPIETVLLPFYRSLKQQPGADVTIIAYLDGHFFRESRPEMASDIRAWLVRQFPQ